MLFIAPFSVAGLSIQWGNNLMGLVVIWLMGLIIIWRAKRLHITLTYALFMVGPVAKFIDLRRVSIQWVRQKSKV